MRRLTSWDLESNIGGDENTVLSIRVAMSAISSGQMIKVADLFSSDDEEVFLKGTFEDEEVTRYIDLYAIARESDEWYVAISASNKRYYFSPYHRYDYPTLLGWRFENEEDGQGVDRVINSGEEYFYDKPVRIMGYAADIPTYPNGKDVCVSDICRLRLSAKDSNLLFGIDKSDHVIYLPLDQRVGFIHAESVSSWSLKVGCALSDEVKQFINGFDKIFSLREEEADTLMDKRRIGVPSKYNITVVGEGAPVDIVSSFIRIVYKGSVKIYAQTKKEIRELILEKANKKDLEKLLLEVRI